MWPGLVPEPNPGGGVRWEPRGQPCSVRPGGWWRWGRLTKQVRPRPSPPAPARAGAGAGAGGRSCGRRGLRLAGLGWPSGRGAGEPPSRGAAAPGKARSPPERAPARPAALSSAGATQTFLLPPWEPVTPKSGDFVTLALGRSGSRAFGMAAPRGQAGA